MELRYLFKKTQTTQDPETNNEEQIPSAPQGLFHKCARCGETIFSEELRKDLFVCPSCGNYFRMYASTRIAMMADEGTFEE